MTSTLGFQMLQQGRFTAPGAAHEEGAAIASTRNSPVQTRFIERFIEQRIRLRLLSPESKITSDSRLFASKRNDAPTLKRATYRNLPLS
jgi:hypothetical protein